MIAASPITVAGGALLAQDRAAIGMFVALNVEDRALTECSIAEEPYHRANLFDSIEVVQTLLMTPEPEPGFLTMELGRQREADLSAKR
jgi:hypothetical protein